LSNPSPTKFFDERPGNRRPLQVGTWASLSETRDRVYAIELRLSSAMIRH
jgi:hypothetical protein